MPSLLLRRREPRHVFPLKSLHLRRHQHRLRTPVDPLSRRKPGPSGPGQGASMVIGPTNREENPILLPDVDAFRIFVGFGRQIASGFPVDVCTIDSTGGLPGLACGSSRTVRQKQEENAREGESSVLQGPRVVILAADLAPGSSSSIRPRRRSAAMPAAPSTRQAAPAGPASSAPTAAASSMPMSMPQETFSS
jgi:hypothetical protein